jgi:hypothetical protein
MYSGFEISKHYLNKSRLFYDSKLVVKRLVFSLTPGPSPKERREVRL